jgi:hypothetical protein
VGAVLVHIDLDGERAHASSLAALAAGRIAASSWGATLYAAIVIHDPTAGGAPDATGRISHGQFPLVESIRAALARAGADKVVVASIDTPVAPLWAAIGGAWQGVLDHLRPRLVLFGADAPSSPELGPRTAARIGARLLVRARAVGVDQVELRDHEGHHMRATDGGAAVALIAAMPPSSGGDDDIDLVMLAIPGAADPRVELAGTQPAELVHATGVIVTLDDAAAATPAVVAAAGRLANRLGARMVGSPGAVRAGAITPAAIVERTTPLVAELCIAIADKPRDPYDIAGATSVIRIGSAGKQVDGAVGGPVAPVLAELVRRLVEPG